MTLEQLNDLAMKHNGDISTLQESLKSAHKRIDENDRITEGIHKLAANMTTLTMQVKTLAENMDASIIRIEGSLQRQGERIGELEKEPAAKWKSLIAQVTAIIVAAAIGGLMAQFIG